MDLFVVPTIGFELFYAFVIVRLDRRDMVWINVTRNPTAEWVARQITEAFPWDEAPKYLIRDRDRIYGTIVTRRLRAMGIRDKPTAPASPWQNGFAERLIGSIRRESLDHIVVFCEAHLRRSLRSYARYYNDMRTHRSRPVHSADFIITTPGFRFSVHTQGPAPDTKPKLRFLSSELAPHYSPTYSPIGRPSIDPEPMIRMPPTGHGVL
jgi:transposase InsO family protein